MINTNRIRIFITGGTGFVGCSLINELESVNIEFVALVRSKSNKLENILNLTQVVGDLMRPETYEKHIDNIDVVIHLAAIVDQFH